MRDAGISRWASRFGNSEMALQSPRLWFWENRQKLLQMACLAHAFLLSLLRPEAEHLRDQLFMRFCHAPFRATGAQFI